MLGAERERLIARITSCMDPYKERKVKENELDFPEAVTKDSNSFPATVGDKNRIA